MVLSNQGSLQSPKQLIPSNPISYCWSYISYHQFYVVKSPFRRDSSVLNKICTSHCRLIPHVAYITEPTPSTDRNWPPAARLNKASKQIKRLRCIMRAASGASGCEVGLLCRTWEISTVAPQKLIKHDQQISD